MSSGQVGATSWMIFKQLGKNADQFAKSDRITQNKMQLNLLSQHNVQMGNADRFAGSAKYTNQNVDRIAESAQYANRNADRFAESAQYANRNVDRFAVHIKCYFDTNTTRAINRAA